MSLVTDLVTVRVKTFCELGINTGSYEGDNAALKKWLVLHNATYYARPRESFSLVDARRQALKEGKTIVVVEDLS